MYVDVFVCQKVLTLWYASLAIDLQNYICLIIYTNSIVLRSSLCSFYSHVNNVLHGVLEKGKNTLRKPCKSSLYVNLFICRKVLNGSLAKRFLFNILNKWYFLLLFWHKCLMWCFNKRKNLIKQTIVLQNYICFIIYTNPMIVLRSSLCSFYCHVKNVLYGALEKGKTTLERPD